MATCDVNILKSALGIQQTGPRTVIVPADPIIWDAGTSYEYMTLVASADFAQAYISKKDVPAGTQLTNTEYWIPAATFNAQLAHILAQLATKADADTVETLSNTVDTLTESVNNFVPGTGIFGMTRLNDKTNMWVYVYSPDGVNWFNLGPVPSRGTSYDYSDASSLFEYNGVLYYPCDSYNAIFTTTDLSQPWNVNNSSGYPDPLGSGYKQWAPQLFKDGAGNVHMAIARQYNGTTFTNATGATTYNFRIDVFDCTIGENGHITVGESYTTVTNSGSYIDPSFGYFDGVGFVMACKNETTCQIEIFNGTSLATMTNVLTLPAIGVEAPMLIGCNGGISVYYEGYDLRTVNNATNSESYNKFPRIYFYNDIKSYNTDWYDRGAVVTHLRFNMRHVGMIANSAVAMRYVSNRPMSPIYDDRTPVTLIIDGNNDDTVYVMHANFDVTYNIRGGARTITFMPGTNLTSYDRIGYIQMQTNNNPTIISNGVTMKKISDGETIPVRISTLGITVPATS